MSLPQQIANLLNNNSSTIDDGTDYDTVVTAVIAAANITYEETFTKKYLSYLILIQYWCSLVCYAISFCCFSKLFYDYIIRGKETTLRYTPCITIFMCFAMFTSLFSFIHLIYLAMKWRPEENVYNPKTLFWTGVLQVLFQIGFSCSLFFQTIDRIIHLLLSNNYSFRFQKTLAFTSLGIICIFLISTSVKAIPAQIDYSAKKVCRTSSCQIFNGPGLIFLNSRFVISGINAVMGAFFYIIFRIYLQRMKESRRVEHQRQKKMRTPMISIAILLEFFFTFCPFCIAFYTFRVFGQNLSTYTGQYSQLFNSFQFLLLGIVYYRSFKGLQWRQKPGQRELWAIPTNPSRPRTSTARQRGSTVEE